jgi:ASCH domain-containing protein
MNTALPALSLRQPWAWAVLHAGKTIENRTWATGYRGRIRIHAAKTWDPAGEAFLAHAGLPGPTYFQLRDQGQIGAYVGEVTVSHCQAIDPSYRARHAPWAFGPVCWELADPMAYPTPTPGRGYPGLYLPERFTAGARDARSRES